MLLIAFMEKYGVQQALLETFAELRSYIPIQVMETAINKFKQQEEYIPFWPLEPWGRDLPLEPLLALANDHEYDQYDEAIAALGWLQDRAPLDFLLKLLESEDEEEMESAAKALSRMGKYAPLDALLEILSRENGMEEEE